MNIITLSQLLGIDPPDPTAAAALLPDSVSLTPGFNIADDRVPIAALLESAIVFKNVHAGVDGTVALGGGPPGQISLIAEMHINGLLQTHPLYLRAHPDIGLTVLATVPDAPARCFFASDGRGYELRIESLPVIITLKSSMLTPLDDTKLTEGDPLDFKKNDPDAFAAVRNQSPNPSQLYVKANIHLHTDGSIVIEASVPIDQPGSRFLGLPVQAVYDINLIPSPNRIDDFEWARHGLGTFISNPPVSGAIAFRSIAFDFSKSPFSDLVDLLRGGATTTGNVDLVCEDVVIPLFSPIGVFPVPSHGTFGFRRKIVDRHDIANAFSLSAAPVVIQLYPPAGKGVSGGSTWSLSIDELLFQTGTPPVVSLQMAVVWQGATGATVGASFGIADDWTLQVGIVLGASSPLHFTIADTIVSLHGAKFGIGIGRLNRGEHFKDSYQILGDISIKSVPSSSSVFKMQSLSGKPLDIILRDIGWSFGHLKLSGLEVPEGVQLIFGGVVTLIIEEMGWVEEPSGTPYFSFSGGVALSFGGGKAPQPTGTGNAGSSSYGIRFRRLRFRTRDDPHAPFLKLDGLFIDLRFSGVVITGFGFISDFEADGFQINEWGFGVKVEFNALAKKFSIAAEFIKGRRKQIDPPHEEFGYFLAFLSIGYIPAGTVELFAVRLLWAENMVPQLHAAPEGEGMQLYHWYRDHADSIEMPQNRSLSAWKPQNNSVSAGVGCGFSVVAFGALMHVNLFIFITTSEEDDPILVVGEAFLLKNPKPIAWVAVEYDPKKDKFGILIGVDLVLTDFLAPGQAPPAWMGGLLSLSGSIFFGNQPWTFAIGQLADQRSWLGIRAHNGSFITLDFTLAFCLQIVEGGPKGFGFVFSMRGGADWGIGAFVVYGSFGLMVGCWKTGSDTSGIEVWIQLGFKIHLFFVFHFGADITIRLTYLGKHPWFTTLSAEVRIDTPWWLPDVTFRVEKRWGEQLPFATSTVRQCLVSSESFDETRQTTSALFTPPLSAALGDEKFVYSFDELNIRNGALLGDVHLRDDIPIVATTATIALNFSAPVSNDMGVAPDVGDAGVQKVQDLTARYALKSLSIRRSPRFGPGAGTWTDLVSPADTELDISGGGTVHTTPTIALHWQLDARADGKLAPNRLLINGSSAFTFTVGGEQADEEALRNDPNTPCCGRPRPAVVHELTFVAQHAGARLPRRQQFTGDGAWWQWGIDPTPLAAPSIVPADGGRIAARLHPAVSIALGSVDFPDPAITVTIEIDWNLTNGRLSFEAWSGVTLVGMVTPDLAVNSARTYTMTAGAKTGITRLLLRAAFGDIQPVTTVRPAAFSFGAPKLFDLQIVRMAYVTVADAARVKATTLRCADSGAAGGGGKLAFLPNHDYEVVIKSELQVTSNSQGMRKLNHSQPSYFRTKGLPGLNAPQDAKATMSDELPPMIESTYPPTPHVLVYRQEPVVLAFTEMMSSLLPVDPVPPPGAPPEKTQLMELVLNIDRVGSTDGLRRLTVPSNDWIDAHRMTVGLSTFPLTDNTRVLRRQASTLDPSRLRFERLLASTPRCRVEPLHASQVLLHDPVTEAGDGGPWQPQTTFRATVRRKLGPYAERSGFDAFDTGAFRYSAESGPPAMPWSVSADRHLVGPAGGVRQYAAIGETSWNHVQLHTRLALDGAAAGGLAVGLAAGTDVPQALTATVEIDGGGRSLVVRRRAGGVVEASAQQPIASSDDPVTLSLYAFDDRIRAVVGEAVVELDRGAVRDGLVGFVSDGATHFLGLAVDGLDLHRFEFATSRYNSFEEHIGSFDGNLQTFLFGSAGPASTSVAAWLATHTAGIAAVMQPDADPQARQAIFTDGGTSLAVPLRQRVDHLAMTRIVDVGGTRAILIESPEPIAFSSSVTAALIHHVATLVFPPFAATPLDPIVVDLLTNLRRDGSALSLPASLSAMRAGDRLVEIDDVGGEVAFTIFDRPKVVDDLRQRALAIPLERVVPQEGTRPDLDPLRGLPAGSVAVVSRDGTIGGVITLSRPSVFDVQIPLVVLTSGDETSALLFPVSATGVSGALSAGSYTLSFTLVRDRWRAAAPSPDMTYQQDRALALFW